MADTQDQKVCKNCDNSFTNLFCNHCGQKEARRITVPHVMHDLSHVFLHADKGIFNFIPRLVLYPGTMAGQFIEGKRKIFNPFQYLIFSVGIMLFLLVQSQFYETVHQYQATRYSRLPVHFRQGIADFNNFVRKYANVITFLSLPIYAWFSWLLFRRRKNNYAEHLTVQVFVMSQANTINALLLLVAIILNVTGFSTIYFHIILNIVCLAITYRQFYNLTWPYSVWKGLLVYFFAYAVQFVLLATGLVIYVLSLKNRQ